MSGRTYLGRTGQKRQDPRPVQPCYVCPVRRHKLFWRFALSGGWMCWASVTAQIARHGPGTPTERITAAPMTKGQHEPATNKRPVPQKKKKRTNVLFQRLASPPTHARRPPPASTSARPVQITDLQPWVHRDCQTKSTMEESAPASRMREFEQFTAPSLEELLPQLSSEEQGRLQGHLREHDRLRRRRNRKCPPSPSCSRDDFGPTEGYVPPASTRISYF